MLVNSSGKVKKSQAGLLVLLAGGSLWVAKPQRTNLKCFLRLPEGFNPETMVIF